LNAGLLRKVFSMSWQLVFAAAFMSKSVSRIK
jgi:hypothetical protein